MQPTTDPSKIITLPTDERKLNREDTLLRAKSTPNVKKRCIACSANVFAEYNSIYHDICPSSGNSAKVGNAKVRKLFQKSTARLKTKRG